MPSLQFSHHWVTTAARGRVTLTKDKALTRDSHPVAIILETSLPPILTRTQIASLHPPTKEAVRTVLTTQAALSLVPTRGTLNLDSLLTVLTKRIRPLATRTVCRAPLCPIN